MFPRTRLPGIETKSKARGKNVRKQKEEWRSLQNLSTRGLKADIVEKGRGEQFPNRQAKGQSKEKGEIRFSIKHREA